MARGRKTGGRQAGTPNKATLLKRQALEAAAASDGSPLAFLVSVMHSPHLDARLRLDAAKAAAQYLHTKAKDEAPPDPKLIEASKEPTPCTNYEICERYGSLDDVPYADVLEHYRVRGGEPPSESEWLASRALDQKKDRT